MSSTKGLAWPQELVDPKDVETQTILAGDREGFALTLKNQQVRHVGEEGELPRLDPSNYNDFDICYLFPKEMGSSTKVMSADQVRTELLKICRARVGKSIAEVNKFEKLHPCYGLGKSFSKSMTQLEFGELLKNVFFRVLEHIGAHFVIENGYDKHERIYVRVRLSERGCAVIADFKNYPLQISRECTKYREFRIDPDFIPPYTPYEKLIEEGNVKGVQVANERKIWQRYDRLSRPLKGGLSEENEQSIFRDVDRIRLLRLAVFEFMNVEMMIRRKWLTQSFVLKQPCREKVLKSNWAHLKYFCTTHQPMDEIRNYYGEEIALYYAWLGYYTKCLLLPAVVGAIVGGIGVKYNIRLSFDHPLVNWSRLFYCVFIGIWSVFFFAMWCRKEKLYALRWGVEHAAVAGVSHEEAPFFKPNMYIADPVQPDKFIRYFPPCQRRMRQWLTMAFLVFSCAFVTFLVNDDIMDMVAQLLGSPEGYMGVADWVAAYSPSRTVAYHAATVVLITGLIIKGYDSFFQSMLAWRLGEFENHQYLEHFNNSTNLKLFCFKISGYFSVLFYLAFFKEHFNPCDDTSDGRCLPMLARQLVMFYVMDAVMILSELASPFISYLVTRFLAKPQSNMPSYQFQAYLKSYTGLGGLTGDYLDKIIQFGYTALFSMAVPFLPLFGLLVNLIELRADAYKLTAVYQRPFPRQADGLGMWDDLQRAMTFFGILSNVLLLTFATIAHAHTMAIKLTISLILLLFALAMKDFVEYKLPAESPMYKLAKARMQVVDYEAMWGDKLAAS